MNILQREASAQAISLHYCDLGGFENVSAAISAPPQYVGEITQVPTPLVSASGEPVDVDVSESAIPGGKSGELVFKNTEGNLNVMIAGGQEFFAYAICVE